MKKIGILATIWILMSLTYIILAIIQPTIQELSDNTATELQATSNMSNYPGTLEAVNSFPLIAWFIPGVVGVAATVWILKTD